MVDEKLERVYTIPLGDAYDYTRKRRVPRAVKILRQFVSRHMKVELDEVSISNMLNNSMWTRSIQKPPRRVKVRIIRQGGVASVYLLDEKTEGEKKADKDRAEKEKSEKEKAEKAKKEKPASATKEKEAKESATPKPEVKISEEKKSEEKKREATAKK
jgi:large subunit ribosomal protein L31e